MELKRYLEVDSKTALEKIKSEHGEEALIISSDKVGNKTEVIVGVVGVLLEKVFQILVSGVLKGLL